jgi:DNA recombination protein RmuC
LSVLMEIAVLIFGVLVGGGAVSLYGRARLHALREQIERERATGEEKIALVQRLNTDWEERFKEMSGAALAQSNTSFLALAETKLSPLTTTLTQFEQQTRALEKSRQDAYTQLTTQVGSLVSLQEQLRSETHSLATALRAPAVRGRWGEMQLRRTVEAAGMLEYCDFVEQSSTRDGEGRLLRPDLVVKLPGGRQVVVDAKAPLQALLDSVEGTLSEDDRAAKMSDFARHVRDHIAKLNGKSYWQQFSPTPDFVVMFLPGESFYRAALEQDPELLDLHASSRVIIASPTTLITLLRAIAVGWREEKVAESARSVSELGRELYERLATMVEHFSTVGKRLDGAVQAYNQTVGSLERRVLVSARRFPEHGIGTDKQIVELAPVDKSTQPPQTIELPTRSAADAA